MSVIRRRYRLLADFEEVSEFLRRHTVRYGRNGITVQPYWEYGQTHPAFQYQYAHRIGLWEDDGELVGVVFYESGLGECVVNAAPGYEKLWPEMVQYAEDELSCLSSGRHRLLIWAMRPQTAFRNLLIDRQYRVIDSEPITVFEYAKGFRDVPVPEGFSVISLEDENDPAKINACLWKGFNHGPKPDDDLDCRLQMQSGPHFRKDLATIVKAPDGQYAVYAGMWLDGRNDYAYLEPLATIPEYRRMGLATLALTEAMKKTQKYGATYCFGGSREFYFAIGFEEVFRRETWLKEWD
jgi:GNAT superfamily N-acetyltransferase